MSENHPTNMPGFMVQKSPLSGVVAAAATPAKMLPPKDSDVLVNTTNYRKAFQSSPVLEWGEDNNFPMAIDEVAMKSTVFESGMKVLADHLHGQGFFLYQEIFKDGQRVIEEVNDEELVQYLYDTGYYEYYYKASRELPRWGNLVPLYYMNKMRQIVKLKCAEGPFFRLERPAPKSGRPENCYLSAQWPNGLKLTSTVIPSDLAGWVKRLPLLDEYDYLNDLNLLKTKFTFAQHVKYHTSGYQYGRAPWHSLYLNRWLAVSGSVGEMMVKIYESGMTINYLLYFHADWVKKKYPSWDEKDFNKEKAMTELQQMFEDAMTGKTNAMRSLMLTAWNNTQSGELVKSLTVDTVDNKQREGNWVPDSQAADAQVLFALGIDPSLIGLLQPGGKNAGGSGSNIREASLALNMRLRADRELLHTPFYVLRDYKYPNDLKRRSLKIGTRDFIINTLDQRAASSSKEVTAV